MIVQYVKFKSSLSEDQVLQNIKDREPQYKALPGLLQKYYVQDSQTGEYGGIFVWDSAESMNEFQQSELARSTPAAYQVEGQPRIEILDVITLLRPEALDPASVAKQ